MQTEVDIKSADWNYTTNKTRDSNTQIGLNPYNIVLATTAIAKKTFSGVVFKFEEKAAIKVIIPSDEEILEEFTGIIEDFNKDTIKVKMQFRNDFNPIVSFPRELLPEGTEPEYFLRIKYQIVKGNSQTKFQRIVVDESPVQEDDENYELMELRKMLGMKEDEFK